MLRFTRLLLATRLRSMSKKVPQLAAINSAGSQPPAQSLAVTAAKQKGKMLPFTDGADEERRILQQYPLDKHFVDQLQWLADGLLSVSHSTDTSPPSAPVIRLQHHSVAAGNLQRDIARMTALRLKAVFVEITGAQLLEAVEESVILGGDGGRPAGDDLTPAALSAILAMQKQELTNGLYTYNTAFGNNGTSKRGNKKRQPTPQTDAIHHTDFVMFTMPALNRLLEAYVNSDSDQTIVVYLPDFDDMAPTSKERRLFADFADTFNRLHMRCLFMAPSYQGDQQSMGQPSVGAGNDPSAATLNHDFRLSPSSPSPTSTPQAMDQRYGPLWTPAPSPTAIQDRSCTVTIGKPSDPRRALTLRQRLNQDESLLLHKHNMSLLRAAFREMDVRVEVGENHVFGQLAKRARSRTELNCVAVQACGLAGGTDQVIRVDHIERVLESQPNPLTTHSAATDDAIVARFAHLLNVDQLNNYERQLLRSCVTTPEMLETRYDDIAGNEAVKGALDDLISKPIRHPHLFATGILKGGRSGILLFGPPGTGKTMLARAVAAESGATFIAIGPADLNSKWVGEGEKFARAVFTLARKLAPSVIFLDEIDALLESRDTAATRSSKVDILSELMSQWDGMWDVDNGHLVVMGATNRPYALDAACLRRLARKLLVDLPEDAGRQAILRILLRDDHLDDSVDLTKLAAMTDSFSGSDLKHLCQAAALIAANRTIAADPSEGGKLVLRMADFEGAMERVSASVSSAAPGVVKLRRWNTVYGLSSGARQAHSVGFA